ncbi:MAG: multiheme c-type cytochrome [Kofleriaceae bacterium]
MMRWLAITVVVAACGAEPQVETIDAHPTAELAARLPRAPGEFSPSLVTIDAHVARRPSDPTVGNQLADVDSCATCHADAAAQWGASAHSFASFGNPLYRQSVVLARTQMDKHTSQHCGGCHDMPLMTDGLMTAEAAIPAQDLRAHSGVTCSLCHGVKSVTKDGNGSYVWSREPIDAPVMTDPSSIARHKAQVSVKALGTEICVGCHRGFLSPEMGDSNMPVHLTGLDEPGMWRNSAWAGNGMGRVDKVEQKTCIDCHMEREPASKDEAGAKHGTFASHRFLGGNTWMAAMRGDTDHLHRLQAKLEGAASIDIAGGFSEDKSRVVQWQLPVDGMPVTAGTRIDLDVVIRNLLVGHRFPGGVLDIQDTWIEVELADRDGVRIAQSGLAHETTKTDQDTHVLRTLVVDEHGEVLEEHEMAKMRTQIATQTLAAREAQVIRYAFDVPSNVRLPVTVTARMRHRSRTLAMQEEVCRVARTTEGKQFIAGAKGARSVVIDPCKPQPITLIAETHVQIGEGAVNTATRPAWEREYEHGMALVGTVSERLEEAKSVLESALAIAPAGRPRAMVLTQLGWVASKQGRVDDALALVAQVRALLPNGGPKPDRSTARPRPEDAPVLAAEARPTDGPAVLDAITADALMRVWRWSDAVAPARAAAKKAPGNSGAWMNLARCFGSLADDRDALAAATTGLELSPRDSDLLRSQAMALGGMHRPEAPAALAAYDRFRSPDYGAELRIECAADSARCSREREQGHTHLLHPVR